MPNNLQQSNAAILRNFWFHMSVLVSLSACMCVCVFSETIRRFETVTEGAVRSYVQQVLRALEHMHTQGIAHGAVRLDNIFIDTTGLVKISGFSASRRIRSVRRGKRYGVCIQTIAL